MNQSLLFHQDYVDWTASISEETHGYWNKYVRDKYTEAGFQRKSFQEKVKIWEHYILLDELYGMNDSKAEQAKQEEKKEVTTKASKSWWKFWSSDRAQALREEVIELEAKKKFLQEEMENRLSEQKRMFEQQLHEVKLANKAKDSEFEVKQKEWQQEKDRLIKLNQEDREIYEKRLKEELDFKHKEATALLKLESDQRIKQAEIDAERKILKAEQEADKKLTEETKKLRDGTYQQLSDELTKMHSQGNIASKNQHEAMMKLLDAGVAMRANVNLNGNMQIPEGKMKDAIRDGVAEVVSGVKN